MDDRRVTQLLAIGTGAFGVLFVLPILRALDIDPEWLAWVAVAASVVAFVGLFWLWCIWVLYFWRSGQSSRLFLCIALPYIYAAYCTVALIRRKTQNGA